MKILFVDAAAEIRSVFSLAFSLEGHSTRLAADGDGAIEAVRDEAFDAIVLDVAMPRMNGWDAFRQIRRLPNGQAVPILMFTCYEQENDQRMAREMGASCLLRKPLEPGRLLAHIQQEAVPRKQGCSLFG